MKSVLIDIDGVVGDFVDPVLELINRIGGHDYAPSDITQWDIRAALNLDNYEWAEVVNLIQADGFASRQKLYPGAKQGIKSLIKEGHEIDFVTSDWRGSKTWVYDRNHWLVKHFGSVGKNVTHTSRKHKVDGDMLIEDKWQNAKAWQDAHPDGRAVIWDRPWNRSFEAGAHGIVRVSSWDEVSALLGKMP